MVFKKRFFSISTKIFIYGIILGRFIKDLRLDRWVDTKAI